FLTPSYDGMDQSPPFFGITTFVAVVCALGATGCTGPWSPGRGVEPLAVSHSGEESFSIPSLATDTPTAVQQIAVAKPVPPVTVLTTEQEIALNNLVAEVRETVSLD